MSTEVGISFTGPGFVITTQTDLSEIAFRADSEFKFMFTDSRKLANGMTVGEMHRAFLHRKLEEWIEGNMR